MSLEGVREIRTPADLFDVINDRVTLYGFPKKNFYFDLILELMPVIHGRLDKNRILMPKQSFIEDYKELIEKLWNDNYTYRNKQKLIVAFALKYPTAESANEGFDEEIK